MNLQQYLDVLKRRQLVIIVVLATTVAVFTSYDLFLASPIYEAQSTIRISFDVGISDFYFFQQEENILRLLNTYEFVLESKVIEDKAIARLSEKYGLQVEDGLIDVDADPVPDSELIHISIVHRNAYIARDMANILAALLIEQAQQGNQGTELQVIDEQIQQVTVQLQTLRQNLEEMVRAGASGLEVEALRTEIDLQERAYDRLVENYQNARLKDSLSANSIQLLQPADLPEDPSNAMGLRELGITVVVGLAGGVGLSFVLENLDTRFRSVQQVEHYTRLTVIGSVPVGLMSASANGTEANRKLSEAYRLLALNLQTRLNHAHVKNIMVTSATVKEGKSAVASNLTRLLAEQDKTVFLVRADLRRQTSEAVFGIPENGHAGLSSFLAGTSEMDDIIHPTEYRSLFVISNGQPPPNPTALLATPAMKELVSFLGRQTSVTLFEGPPILGLADVTILSSYVDGVLLVVNQQYSNRDQVNEAVKQLKAINAPVLGIVFVQPDNQPWDY